MEQINELAPSLIKWPSGEERISIKREMGHWGNIPGVVGAIDGTFIPIKAPAQNPEVYNNRKCFHSITLQAICNHERMFTDVLWAILVQLGMLASSGILIFLNQLQATQICFLMQMSLFWVIRHILY